MAETAIVQIPRDVEWHGVLAKPMAAGGTIADALVAIEQRSHGAFMGQDFLDEARRGVSQLWLVWDGEIRAIAGTCIKTTGHGEREAVITFATGEGSAEWRDPLLDEIEEWAGAEGCVRVLPFTRPGWQRWFVGRGYRVRHVELERAL